MKSGTNTTVNFNRHKHKWEVNIGVFVFIIILIYLVGITITYLNEHQISTYEVRYGSIIKDNAYNGLALRQENVYNSKESGYIQFYYQANSRVSVNNNIYSIAQSESNTSTTTNNEGDVTTLSAVDQQKLLSTIQSYNNSYSASLFSSIYELETSIDGIFKNSENQDMRNELTTSNGSINGLNLYETDISGIITYTIDGYETMTADTFNTNAFDKSNYSSTTITSGDKVNLNAPIYRITNDENWSIIIDISETDVEYFQTVNQVTFKFLTDNEIKTAPFSLIEKDDNTFGVIDINTDMVRYCNDRFIDIELILETLEGYKIPVSSVVSRYFYKIPNQYIFRGGENGNYGVMSTTGVDETFKETPLYYKDEEYSYISVDSLSLHELLIPEVLEEDVYVEEPTKFQVSETVELTGVYLVNKGYAEFKIVEILTESSEYFIVKDSTEYSISNYDRIALYGNSVSDNALIN